MPDGIVVPEGSYRFIAGALGILEDATRDEDWDVVETVEFNLEDLAWSTAEKTEKRATIIAVVPDGALRPGSSTCYQQGPCYQCLAGLGLLVVVYPGSDHQPQQLHTASSILWHDAFLTLFPSPVH
ncbi:hypothetical protein LZ30DRAFT_340199 [Colletotrichum cereale]|nr:hypothetical protein LZ30DRAFT_340199 [Colletotrichum cereale]